MEEKVQYYFDASGSKADEVIQKYQFDFGDGSQLEGKEAKVVHAYDVSGEYTVTLTITDRKGKSASTSKKIRVEEQKLVGTTTIRVVDSNGQPMPNMPVYFDMANTTDNVKYTNSQGEVQFSAESGNYVVGSYAQDYLPYKTNVVIQAGKDVKKEITLVKEPIVTGTFEVQRMTLDEIIAAGIDVKNPANQQLVKVNIKIAYGKTPIEMNVKIGRAHV